MISWNEFTIRQFNFIFWRSTQKEFSTSSKRPPPPANIRAERTSPDSITVKWDPMAWPGIRGFRIFYSDKPNPDDMTKWDLIEIGAGSMAAVCICRGGIVLANKALIHFCIGCWQLFIIQEYLKTFFIRSTICNLTLRTVSACKQLQSISHLAKYRESW